jgi:hypothetical protein
VRHARACDAREIIMQQLVVIALVLVGLAVPDGTRENPHKGSSL